MRPVAEDTGTGAGAFKSIGLRNVEFTGPYFHNGGQSTLEQVIDFYRRGGDFTPVANEIRTFNINDSQKAALVAFLKSLSDNQVRYEMAPFDHPELCVPVGHVESTPGVFGAGCRSAVCVKCGRDLAPDSGRGIEWQRCAIEDVRRVAARHRQE